jgi:hypothetical protein
MFCNKSLGRGLLINLIATCLPVRVSKKAHVSPVPPRPAEKREEKKNAERIENKGNELGSWYSAMHEVIGSWEVKLHTKMLYPLVFRAYKEVRTALGSFFLAIVAMICRGSGGFTALLYWTA